jgi:hypothetical protein
MSENIPYQEILLERARLSQDNEVAAAIDTEHEPGRVEVFIDIILGKETAARSRVSRILKRQGVMTYRYRLGIKREGYDQVRRTNMGLRETNLIPDGSLPNIRTILTNLKG